MALLTSNTAGKAKKLYMTGKYDNGNDAKPQKLESLHKQLMTYAESLEEGSASRAQVLKAELHQRATELRVKAAQDVAQQVQGGAVAANKQAEVIAQAL